MKIHEIKRDVFKLIHVISSKELKRQRPEIHKGRDLRLKKNWASILSEVLESQLWKSENEALDIKSMSIGDIKKLLSESEQKDNKAEEKHRKMYYASGSLLGWSITECDKRWKNIQRKAQLKIEADALDYSLS